VCGTGIVNVKGNSVDALTTECIAEDYLVKTETYRFVENEVWVVLRRRLISTRGIPSDASKQCLAQILLTRDRYGDDDNI